MANATDIITYIGVPLAVFGVIPLIWNMVKSFVIRRRLLAIIPRCARQYFTVIMDPAAGTVSVTMKILFIDSNSLLGYYTTGVDPAVEAVQKESSTSWHCITFDEALRAKSRRVNQKLSCSFKLSVPESLQPPDAWWMQLTEAPFSIYTRPAFRPWARYVVDSSLVCSPTRLECLWPVFVYLALGFGVSPKHGLETLANALRANTSTTHQIRLCNMVGQPVMTASVSNGKTTCSLVGGPHEFSLQRALAWESICIVPKDGSRLCVPLWRLDAFDISKIVGFSQEGTVVWYQHPNDSTYELIIVNHRSNRYFKWELFPPDLHLRDFWSDEEWKKCVVWSLYTEGFCSSSDTLPLPAHQRIILIAKDSASKLECLGDERLGDELDRRIVSALDGNKQAAEEIVLYLDRARVEDCIVRGLTYGIKALTPTVQTIGNGHFKAPKNHHKVWQYLTEAKAFQELERNCQPGSNWELNFDKGDLTHPFVFFIHLVLACSFVRNLPLMISVADGKFTLGKEPLRYVLDPNLAPINESVFLI